MHEQPQSPESGKTPRADVPRADITVLATERFLELARDGQWEFVRRTNAKAVVAIAAVTEENRLVLVEQYRPPVGKAVIELPAGLVGDEASHVDEALEDAARRELLEETGYRASRLRRIFASTSSAGLTDESVVVYRASNLVRVSEGGGVEGECITVHEAPLAGILDWLAEKEQSGFAICTRVYACLPFVTLPPAPPEGD